MGLGLGERGSRMWGSWSCYIPSPEAERDGCCHPDPSPASVNVSNNTWYLRPEICLLGGCKSSEAGKRNHHAHCSNSQLFTDLVQSTFALSSVGLRSSLRKGTKETPGLQDATLLSFTLWLCFIFGSVLFQNVSYKLEVLALIFTLKHLLTWQSIWSPWCLWH